MQIKDIIYNKSLEAIKQWYREDKSKFFPDGRQIRILGLINKDQLRKLCSIYPHVYRVWINGQCKLKQEEPDVGTSVDLIEAKKIIETVCSQDKGEFIYVDPQVHGGWGILRIKLSYNSRQRKQTYTKLPFDLAETEPNQKIIYESIDLNREIQKKEEDGYLPTREDFEEAIKKLNLGKEETRIEKVLDLIEIHARAAGNNLKSNWKEITEKNIMENWTKQEKGK